MQLGGELARVYLISRAFCLFDEERLFSWTPGSERLGGSEELVLNAMEIWLALVIHLEVVVGDVVRLVVVSVERVRKGWIPSWSRNALQLWDRPDLFCERSSAFTVRFGDL